MPTKGNTPTTIDRFHAKYVVNERGCWIWQGFLFDRGYGGFKAENDKQVRAHKWAYQHFVGPVPDGWYVCHRCDTPACVNPDHLFLGTPKMNTADMWKKGRQAPRAHGEANTAAKLTETDVIAIRALYATGRMSQRRIGDLFGIEQTSVGLIVRRERWKHVA